MPEDSALSRREAELFSNKHEEEASSREIKLSKRSAELPHSWGNDSQPLLPTPRKRSLGMLFFLASFFILLIAGIFTGWKFLNHGNAVSSANIIIELGIKPLVEGGETAPLSYSIQNKNSLPLVGASLIVQYEKGTGAQDEQNKIREKVDFGDIAGGEIRKGEVPVQLFGAENTSRFIEARLEYKVTGSNAVFSKTVSASSTLKSPPVSVHIEVKDKTSSEQPSPITVTIKNNISTTTAITVLQLTLPTAYVMQSATPSPSNKGTTWLFNNLQSGEEKEVTIQGYFKGSPGEVSSVKALVGSQGSQVYDIGNVYSFDTKEVSITNPGMTVKLGAGRSSSGGSDTTFAPGERVSGYVTYMNASDASIANASVVVSFSGTPFDPNTVTVDGGLYDSTTNTITWNDATISSLKVLPPNGKGTLMFTFVIPTSKDSTSAIILDAAATAETSDGSEHFSSKDTQKWFIEGGATLSAGVKYADSTFTNTGPLPPKANETTTYSVYMQSGAQNGFKNGKMTLSLPLYVTWLNQISGDSVTYDSRTRVITWILGEVSPNQIKKASFKIGVRPSVTHIGHAPQITSGITFEGNDSLSGISLKRVLGALTTHVDDTSTKDISTVVAGASQ